jgi:Zn-dependent peptidase ImmA (M78 family)
MDFLTKDKKDKITEFVKFVKEQLEIEKCPEVILQNGRGKLKTTANYNYADDKKVIRVNGKNRALVDIMRSIAHEMVHHKQFEEGRLKVKPADIGGDIEDEANAKAGQYIKIFAQKDNTIYDE